MSASTENKIAVVGSKDIVLIFKALGMDVYATDNQDTRTVLGNLREKGYKIILITERDASLVGDYIDECADRPYPIILPIPDGMNSFGVASERLNSLMRKILGSAGEYSGDR